MTILTIAATLIALTTAPISSKDAQENAPIVLSAPTMPGATVHGIIDHVEKRGNKGRDGVVTITAHYIEQSDGSRSDASGSLTKRGKSVLADAVSLGIGGLFIKGSHAVIPAGTAVTVTYTE